MSKKILKDKIRQVGFWTFSGVFWYLVISFFLLSDYPIQDQPFNGKDAYMVVKDALGLAAAFLAPVAAFVLFQDWREQHSIISNKKLSEDIIRDLSYIKNYLEPINSENQQNFLAARREALNTLDNVVLNSSKICVLGKKSEEFKKRALISYSLINQILDTQKNIGRHKNQLKDLNDLYNKKYELFDELKILIKDLKNNVLDLNTD